MIHYNEDDVLTICREQLIKDGYTVLVCSGVQGLYYYQYNKGRKFPDVVAVKDSTILIGEGKLKPEKLFAATNNISDADSIEFLKANNAIRDEFIHNIESVLTAQSIKVKKPLVPHYILCAGQGLSNYKTDINNDILLMEVDLQTGNVVQYYGLK